MKRKLFILCGALLAVILVGRCTPYDSTDQGTERRSGLQLYIDHETGCEYISKPYFGSLQPRLDKEGWHICRERRHPADEVSR